MNHFHPAYEELHCGATDGIMCTNPKDITCPVCKENERKQYRLTVTFPRLRFVDSNDMWDQLAHIASELKETHEAMYETGYVRIAEETVDLMQSCATLLYILRDKHSINLDEIVKQVQEKNGNRGYEI